MERREGEDQVISWGTWIVFFQMVGAKDAAQASDSKSCRFWSYWPLPSSNRFSEDSFSFRYEELVVLRHTTI